MATKTWAIVLVVFITLITASAQIFYKFSTNSLPNFGLFLTYLIIGLILYGTSAILLIIALKNGDLSILYPIISMSYVWVAILSMKFFHEPATFLKWAGIAAIILGVSFIGMGSKEKRK